MGPAFGCLPSGGELHAAASVSVVDLAAGRVLKEIALPNGSTLLREWVDDAAATPADLDSMAEPDENTWREQRREWMLYD